jgi:glycosyltransferase involved in cell wall biosynthesis
MTTRENYNPLISVGIPVTKSQFLAKTIRDSLNQSYKHLEILILNNASTREKGDEIEKIVHCFNDKRIFYFRNKTQLPMIQNWNKVLSYANGDYFSLLCDDDYWEREFIEKMIDLAIKYPNTNLFHCRVLIHRANGKEMLLSPLCNEFEDCLDFIYHRIKGWRLQYLSDFMARTSSLREIGGFVDLPDGWGSDDLTWVNLSKKGGVAYNDLVLFNYNDNIVNTTNSGNINNKLIATNIYVKHVYSIISEFPEYNTYNKLKKELIVNELTQYFKRNYLKYVEKKLDSIKYIPSFVIPIYILIAKGINKYNKYIIKKIDI